MWLYRIMFALAAGVAAVFVYFFITGLADGTVSSFNMALWLGTLAVVALSVGGGWALGARGRRGAACALFAILAVPGALGLIAIVVMMVNPPRWN